MVHATPLGAARCPAVGEMVGGAAARSSRPQHSRFGARCAPNRSFFFPRRMSLSCFNKFMVLLWKNFLLKRRQLVVMVVEIILMLLFAGTLLLTRKYMAVKKNGPFIYSAQSLNTFPAFFKEEPSSGPWELTFVPSKSVAVKSIIETVKKDLRYNFTVQGFASEGDFEDYVKEKNNSKKVFVAFVFDHEFKSSHDPLPLTVKYYLRFSSFQRNKYANFFRPGGWETNFLYPTSSSVGPRNENDSTGGHPGYITEGFLVMQHALDRAIMKYHNYIGTQKLLKGVTVSVHRFPHPIYYHDRFFTFVGIFIPLVILFIFSINHLTLIQSIVWEKENRLKEYQLMIGLSNWMLWAAYFFTFLSLYAIGIFLLCIIFFAKIKPTAVIQYSDPSLVFVFLLGFAFATIFFSFMVSTFFNKVNFAVPIGCFLYLLAYLPANIITSNYAETTFIQKLAACLSSNIAMVLGARFLVRAEMTKVGVKWSNLFSTKVDNFVFAYILGMFLLDGFLYGLVTWYIEAVFPGQYGVSKPWNFFLLRSYWCGETIMKKNKSRQFYETIESKYFEPEPTGMVAGIELKHLCKTFHVQNSTKKAIEDLSLSFYEGQITVLLGCNGAGKSTTLSILSGLYPATSGEVCVNGYDISKYIVQIRRNLGICPQQDLLFNYMTVSEHLHFYCVIKGIPQKMRPMEIDHMLSTFNLLGKRNAFSESLSGGMKRRLSIIIALIGGSKVVILDEPTSSMDPASRRATWDLLQHYKQNRTILLTTHYMDEADVLGDRIAIMVKGTLRCCGSSLFLKKLYGVGYHIVMVKEPHCNVEEISELIHCHISVATLEKNAVNELSFILPKEYTHRFEVLFTDLEKRQKELGIANFGISVTTMEEVFLRVSNTEDSQTDIQATQTQPSLMSKVSIKNQNKSMSRNDRIDSSSVNESPTTTIMYNTECCLYYQQFHAMFVKKVMFSWRNWKLILLQIMVFLGSLAFLLEVDRLSHINEDKNARQMNLDQYGQTIVPLSISGNSNFTVTFLEHLKITLQSEKHTLKEVQGNLLKYLLENEECINLCIVAFSIEVKKGEVIVTAFFNNQAYHSPPLALAMVDNILFKSVSGPDASLTISNKPQPRSETNDHIDMNTDGHQVAFNIHFGMAFLISGFCLLTVTERVSKAKHIQFVSGVYVSVYWLSALLWDLIVFFISCCLLLGVFKYCHFDIFLKDYHFLDTLLIFTLYGFSAIPLMYLLSFLFSKSTSAYIMLVLFNYFSGIFTLLIDAALELGEGQDNMPDDTRTFILNLLLLFPNYNLGKWIGDYFDFYQRKKWCAIKNAHDHLACSGKATPRNFYSLTQEVHGKNMIVMTATGFIFLLLIFFWETTLWKLRPFFNQYVYFGIYKKFKRKSLRELYETPEDEDVQNERKRILGQSRLMLKSAVLIKELTKIYFNCPVIVALKKISLGVQNRECFGLLGFNGAGKTTTFQILAGEQTVTSGDVFIDDLNIAKNTQKVMSRVGYCPQSDALLEYMTGREIMIMYARLWGVCEPQIQLHVNKWLNVLQLEPHADKLIRNYSGGNKRKLSTILALMGKPSVVLLDEPSAGMDPVAQHLLWNAVTMAKESGKAIIISSHRLEKCDAFCTRLAIMVQGEFVCLGSPQQLKSKFGGIYALKVKVKTDTSVDVLNSLKFFITIAFPGSELKQENQGILNYYIHSKDKNWGKMFGILEEAKEQFNLEDYSISQITLEQVFLTFASQEETNEKASP